MRACCVKINIIFLIQVHEKSILLAAIPVTLHLAMSIASLPSTRTNSFPGSSADHLKHWVERHSIRADVWFLVISVFSMLPLLIK